VTLGRSPLRPDPRQWRRRIHRAHELADQVPEAAALLRFYSALADVQEPLFLHPDLGRWISRETDRGRTPGLGDVPWSRFQGELELFLEDVGKAGPPGLRDGLEALAGVRAEELLGPIVREEETNDAHPAGRFLALAFVEPFATRLAAAGTGRQAPADEADSPSSGPPRCPVCHSGPLLAVLDDRGDRPGARSLQCPLCSTRWPFPRLTCVACGETSPGRLGQKASDRWPWIRVEVCQACRSYTKTVDLRKEGRAVPEVEDLASAALDVWAAGQGWTRTGRGLLTP